MNVRRLPMPHEHWSITDKLIAYQLLAESAGFASAIGQQFPTTGGLALEAKIDTAIGTKPSAESLAARATA